MTRFQVNSKHLLLFLMASCLAIWEIYTCTFSNFSMLKSGQEFCIDYTKSFIFSGSIDRITGHYQIEQFIKMWGSFESVVLSCMWCSLCKKGSVMQMICKWKKAITYQEAKRFKLCLCVLLLVWMDMVSNMANGFNYLCQS